MFKLPFIIVVDAEKARKTMRSKSFIITMVILTIACVLISVLTFWFCYHIMYMK